MENDPGPVWHVGYAPDAWAWADWRFAILDGKFHGRWDDPAGQFRTLYVGDSLFACLVEVLAKFRPEKAAALGIASIHADGSDDEAYPTWQAGTLDRDWLETRLAAAGDLLGKYCSITHSQTIAHLRPRFLELARELGAADFDASLLKDSAPRSLTRAIARWLYDRVEDKAGAGSVDGIGFLSRHGDDLRLWAVFERPDDEPMTPRIHGTHQIPLRDDSVELIRAFHLHGLIWKD